MSQQNPFLDVILESLASRVVRFVTDAENCRLEHLRPHGYGESVEMILSPEAQHALYEVLGQHLGQALEPMAPRSPSMALDEMAAILTASGWEVHAPPPIRSLEQWVSSGVHHTAGPMQGIALVAPPPETLLAAGLRFWQAAHPQDDLRQCPEIEAQLRIALAAQTWPLQWDYADHAPDLQRTLPQWYPSSETDAR